MANIALNIAIFLPAVAAIVIWNLPERRADLAKVLSLVTGTLIFMLGFGLWLALPATGLLAETHVPWIKLSEGGLTLLDISYHVGLDAISGSLVALTGLLVPLSVWCSFSSIRKREREYYAWMMGLTAAMVGVFAARDLLLFYIFFEFTLVPLYFLIGIWAAANGATRRTSSSYTPLLAA
jgi:NADH-quinone oxidoreductase subunit M